MDNIIIDLNDYKTDKENDVIELNDFMNEIHESNKERYKKDMDDYFEKNNTEQRGIKATDPNIDYKKVLEERIKDVKLDLLVDDSFVDDEDKKNLIEYAKFKCNTEFKFYPYPMNEAIIEKIYNDCIKNLDKEEYLKEKEEMKNKSILKKEIMKINKLSGL